MHYGVMAHGIAMMTPERYTMSTSGQAIYIFYRCSKEPETDENERLTTWKYYNQQIIKVERKKNWNSSSMFEEKLDYILFGWRWRYRFFIRGVKWPSWRALNVLQKIIYQAISTVILFFNRFFPTKNFRFLETKRVRLLTCPVVNNRKNICSISAGVSRYRMMEKFHSRSK